MTVDDSESPREGPEFDVWNHLESGWQQAYDDMAQRVGRETMQLFEGIAKAIVSLRTDLVLSQGSLPIPKAFGDVFPKLSPAQLQDLAAKLLGKPDAATSNVWMRHAVDLEVAEIGLHRAIHGLDRFKSLTPVLTHQAIPPQARAYLREVVHTYLLGFDAACIALCRACFDQIGKAVLVRSKVLSEAEVRKGHLTTLTLVEKLKQNGLVSGAAYDAGRRLGERGNTIMHKGLYEERVLPSLSLDSISDLLAVSVVLAEKW
jgi:hypothetical protein